MPHPRRPLGSAVLDRFTRRARTGSVPYRVADRLQRVLARRQLPPGVAHHPMVRLDGQLYVVADVPTVDENTAVRQNLDAVRQAATDSGHDHFLITATRQGRARVGVLADSLASLVAHLATVHPDAYVDFTDAGGQRRELVSQVTEADLRGVEQLCVFELVRPNPAIRPFGVREACWVDLWHQRGDELVSEVANPVTTVVEPSVAGRRQVVVADRTLPTLDAFTSVRFDEVTFPIDAVYMWVDGADPDWRTRRDAALAEERGHQLGAAPSRFREYGELRYSLRSIERFAPWIRHVYLVTDQQRPDWLVDDHPGLTVVDHRDIFTDRDVLPTFNSHAISTQLHHIDGLADHYLVFNDDVLLGRPVEPELFFDANGVARFFLSRSTVPAGTISEDDLPHEAARKRARDLVQGTYGHMPTRTFKHTPISQVRPLQQLLEDRHGDEYRRTAANRFRSNQDIEPVSWLHHYAGYFERWARPATISYDYFDISDRRALTRMEGRLAGRSVDCLCVNDGEEGDAGVDERARRLRAFFDHLLPDRSSFERPDG